MAADVTHYSTLIQALEAAPADRDFVTLWIDEDERETVTFHEFRQQARSQAAMLRNQGVERGDRVIVLMPQTIAAMTAFVGAMMLGTVPAFLAYPNFKIEPAKYRAGLAGVSKNLGAKLVVIDDAFPDEMLAYISLGRETKILRIGDGKDFYHAGMLQSCETSSDDLAFVQHSAGTTGLQKGIALTHAAVLRQLENLAEALAIDGASDRIYSWLPLYHDMGLVACFLLPMVCHVPLVMQSPLDWVMRPETMLQIFTECRCTLGWMPNFGFQFVPRRTPRSHWAKYDLSSARALINCSEPVRSNSMLEFERAFSPIGLKKNVLQSCYAMAENVFAVTQSKLSPTQLWVEGRKFRSEQVIVPTSEQVDGAVSFTSSGQLLPGNDVRVVDDAGPIISPGHVGEILIRSDSLFNGYYNSPALTDQAFVDGWYRTGDLGFMLSDELYVVGRKKDLLIIGGENLYPQDIEEIVATHPAIHDGRVIAMGLYNPDLGTEDLVIVAEVEREELLADAAALELEIRRIVTAGTGVAPKKIFVKPPQWIVKSTAGKPARSATREKLIGEHPELADEEAA